MQPIDPTAAAGFAAAADDYERHRPGYPPAAVRWLADELGLAPERTVLDLAAGTGKLTRELVGLGARVVAVEPVADMRRVLRDAVPAAAVVAGTAEAIPLPDTSMDAATAAQAFHWFDADRALAELRRVLVPDGALGVVFNERDLTSPLQSAIDDLLSPYRGATPSWAGQRWQNWLDAPTGFAPPARFEVTSAQRIDLAGLLGRVRSVSFVATLGEDDRVLIERELRALFEREQAGGTVVLRYRTKVWVLRRDG